MLLIDLAKRAVKILEGMDPKVQEEKLLELKKRNEHLYELVISVMPA